MTLSVSKFGLTSLPIIGFCGIIITIASPIQAQTEPVKIEEKLSDIQNPANLEKSINEAIQNELDQLSQPFVNFAAVVAQPENITAVSGELEFSPEKFLEKVDVTLNVESFENFKTFEQIDPQNNNFSENNDKSQNNKDSQDTALAIDVKFQETNQLNKAIEKTIANLDDDPAVANVISATELFLTEVVKRQQSRLTVAAAKQNQKENLNSALITKVELSPVQRFANNLNDQNSNMLIDVGTDKQDRVLNKIIIESKNQILVDNKDNKTAEVELARAIEKAGSKNQSDIISLVEAFGNGFEQQQARISGGALIQHNNSEESFTSAVIGEVELAPGQLIATQKVSEDTKRLVTVTAGISEKIDGNNVVGVDKLAIDYHIADEGITLESAIAETVNKLEQAPDVISLVEAFVSGREEKRLPDAINQVEQPQPEQPTISLD